MQVGSGFFILSILHRSFTPTSSNSSIENISDNTGAVNVSRMRMDALAELFLGRFLIDYN